MSEAEVNIALKAVDEASAVVKDATDNVKGSISQVENSVQTATVAQEKANVSTKQLAGSMNNLATSGFALYMSIDRIQNAQLAADKAATALHASNISLAAAQEKYTKILADSSASANDLTKAEEELKLAQERQSVAARRAEQIQNDVNNTMMSSALTIIPSVMTMATSLSTVYTSLTAGTGALTGATGMLSGAFTALKAVMVAHPLLLAATIILGVAAAIITAYETCEPFRNAINAIGSTLYNFFKPAIDAVTWAFSHWADVVKAFGLVWEAIMAGLKFVWDRTIGPIIDGIRWLIDAIAGVGKALGGLGGGAGAGVGASGVGTVVPALPGAAYVGVLPGMQRGGIAFKPTVAVVGEIPEAIVPLSRLGRMGGGVTVEIKSPLVYIEGSADKETVKKAAKDVLKVLDSVIIEATSSGASTKRIREGTRIV